MSRSWFGYGVLCKTPSTSDASKQRSWPREAMATVHLDAYRFHEKESVAMRSSAPVLCYYGQRTCASRGGLLRVFHQIWAIETPKAANDTDLIHITRFRLERPSCLLVLQQIWPLVTTSGRLP